MSVHKQIMVSRKATRNRLYSVKIIKDAYFQNSAI